jgi:uncharacterized membrane protein (UPF0127 family)
MQNFVKDKKIISLSLLIIFCICVVLIFLKIQTEKPVEKNMYVTSCGEYAQENFSIDGKIIQADIADTDCKKTLGLSGRTTLTDGQGMLFLFNTLGSYGFWMKDMNFPLDIIWIDNTLSITGIESNLATSTYDVMDPSQSEIFGQKYSAEYVLEVPAGYVDRNNIKVGDKIIFSE